jgi:hypothetical protein
MEGPAGSTNQNIPHVSFRLIAERIARIARATVGGGSRAGGEALRKAEELIAAERAREVEARRRREESRRAELRKKEAPQHDPAVVEALRLFGLPPGVPFAEVTAAYRVRIIAAHPDRNQGAPRQATEEAQRLNAAYAFLKKNYER